MDFHFSKPFGSYRLVTCLSKRKIHSYHVNENRNEIILVKWSNGTSNRYHMCPVYYRCRFKAYEDVTEFREKYNLELTMNSWSLTYTQRFSKQFNRVEMPIRKQRFANTLAELGLTYDDL